MDYTTQNLLRRAMEELELSARAYDRILKVSRTIADLADSQTITAEHVSEAIQYRTLDRQIWTWPSIQSIYLGRLSIGQNKSRYPIL